MKSLFPKLEIYKHDADVTAGDIPDALVTELGEVFKKHGLFVRFLVQTGQEQEVKTKLIARLINLFRNRI